MFMRVPADDADKEAERLELKVGMRQSAVQTKVKMSGLKDGNRLEKEVENALAIEQQLNAPVAAPVIAPEECHIGKWSGSIINGTTYEDAQELFSGSRYDELPKNQSDYLQNIKRENQKEDALAFYSSILDSIYLQSYTPQEVDFAYNKEYANQNPIAENSIAYHEALHKRHSNHNGMSDTSRAPANTLRTDRLTETTAHAVQYLSTANTYTFLKNQGIETFEYTQTKDDKEKTLTMPLDDVLDMYPGLREAMDGKDFSPDDPEMVRKIVAASAKNWNNHYKDTYYEQHCNVLGLQLNSQKDASFSFRLRNTRNQETRKQDFAKLSQEMLKDIYIGNNTTVNLTDCEDLLNTMSAEEADKIVRAVKVNANLQNLDLNGKDMQTVNKWLDEHGITDAKAKDDYLGKALTDITELPDKPSTNPELQNLLAKAFISSSPEPSDEEIFAINNYLEKKGITEDAAKDAYLKKAFTDIVNRSPEADMELKKLLMGANGSVKYTDGLTASPVPGTPYTTVTDTKGQTYNVGTLETFSARLRETPANENTQNNHRTAATLAPADLKRLHDNTR